MTTKQKYQSTVDMLSKGGMIGGSGPHYKQYGDPEAFGKAMSNMSMEECGGYSVSSRMGFDPQNIGGNGISGRYDFTTSDYEAWRPHEKSQFRTTRERILHADRAYQEHGLIKNVIDLMGDFGSQGIRLVHPNKRAQRFYQSWFDKVNGVEVSDKILNILYRLANCPIRIQTAKINKGERDKMFRATAKPDMTVDKNKVHKYEIPWKYTILHPATIVSVGGPLSNFSNKPRYAVKMPSRINSVMMSEFKDGSIEKQILDSIPADIRKAMEDNKPILLPEDKFKMLFYKKDDWQEFANPIISSIATDISLYEKLKLADRAALDGAISNIRIFKLGSLEHGIAPQPEAFKTLAAILESNTEAGTIDLVWGPDIELLESKTEVHKFLGDEKYRPTMMAIYAGLGIPPTLTGTFGASGTTNNYVSLKTLTQRLNYGREILIAFWNEQIKLVQEAMGFKYPARIEFDMMNLGDETAEKALLIQLSDRNLISDELIQRYWRSDPEMENIRTKNEYKERKNGTRAEKSGPYYSPQIEDALKKIALQSGVVTPSQVGLELEEAVEGQVPALTMRNSGQQEAKPKGQPQQGRPKNSKDSTKRKEKEFKPKTRAVWAFAALQDIADITNPIILEQFGKKNMRSLSAEEFKQAEKFKFGVLSNMRPFAEITESTVAKSAKTQNEEASFLYDDWESKVSKEVGRKLTVNEQRMIQANIYSYLNGEEE